MKVTQKLPALQRPQSSENSRDLASVTQPPSRDTGTSCGMFWEPKFLQFLPAPTILFFTQNSLLSARASPDSKALPTKASDRPSLTTFFVNDHFYWGVCLSGTVNHQFVRRAWEPSSRMRGKRGVCLQRGDGDDALEKQHKAGTEVTT